jgi:hypothetical protein
MRKILVFGIIALCPALWGPAASAQDCRFKIKGDESLKQAMNSFHEVMSGLVHGAADEGDLSQVKAKAEELAKLRDGIMAANLPEKLAKRCPDISAKAAELSKAVDTLAAQSRSNAGNDAVKLAFDTMHTAYRNLNNSLVSLEDRLEAFHEVMHPLWHDAYPR